ncbi:MAG: hypothetical protein J6R46_02675 [Clostridia bacterium]|jgi:hypothetical protein|nr:hypothetical protein [Clostridia bacterium]
MKIKLISFAIILICLLSSVTGGLLSVYRSEGRIISPEEQAKIEAFLEQYGIDMPNLPAFLTE